MLAQHPPDHAADALQHRISLMGGQQLRSHSVLDTDLNICARVALRKPGVAHALIT